MSQQHTGAIKASAVHTRVLGAGGCIETVQNLPSILPTRFDELHFATSSEDKFAAKPRHTRTGRVARACILGVTPRLFTYVYLRFDFVVDACPATRLGEMSPFVCFS